MTRLPVVGYLAWSDTRARYRRSVLGPLWLTLGTAVGVAGLGLVWSELLNVDRTVFVPSLTSGLICWQLISGCIVEGSTVFVRHAIVIRNTEQSFFTFPMLLVARHGINFLHNLLVYVAVALWFHVPFTAATLLVIPIFAGLLVTLTSLTLLIGMLGARFRDIEPTIAAFMPLLFFLSPVLWRHDQLPFTRSVVVLNPFTYYLTIIREPMLGRWPPTNVVLGALAISVGILVTAAWLFAKRRSRIPFWL